MRQSQVDKLYAGLKDLSEERRGKLDERFRLFQLNREVDDLEQWIAEREVVAGSHELGQDYEHVTVRRQFDLQTHTHMHSNVSPQSVLVITCGFKSYYSPSYTYSGAVLDHGKRLLIFELNSQSNTPFPSVLLR